MKETLVFMCLASLFTLSRPEKWMLDIATYIMQKLLKFFMCGGYNSLKKVKYNEAHIFPRPLQQTCRLETTLLCINTRLFVNKKFQNSH